MHPSILETTDIFKGAFYLCMGAELAGIRFKPGGREIAVFHFSGRHLNRYDTAYVNGCARVNPLQLKEALNRLRDVLFDHLREREGRYVNDSKGAHRAHQTRCRP